jgi:hypothetical protein
MHTLKAVAHWHFDGFNGDSNDAFGALGHPIKPGMTCVRHS